MGLLEKSCGNLQAAQKFLERAVRLRDGSHSAHAALGSLFMDRNTPHRAVDHLNRALELKPSATTHFMLGTFYCQDGHQRRAIKHLKEATHLDPKFGEAFYQLGLAYRKLNWSKKAQECFQHAQELDPREVRYHCPSASSGKSDRQSDSHFRDRLNPDQLSGLVSEELHLTTCWDPKRSK